MLQCHVIADKVPQVRSEHTYKHRRTTWRKKLGAMITTSLAFFEKATEKCSMPTQERDEKEK